MAVDAQHPDYAAHLADWQKIEDITKGKNISRFLVYLNPHDQTPTNVQRNKDYRNRAVFYGLTGQTVIGLLGTIFRKWPQADIPASLEYLFSNCDGAGNSIYQQSQSVCDDVIRKARAGLAVAFPQTSGSVSRADILSGRVVATIHKYEPEQIINWRTMTEGAITRLSLVVLRESVEGEGEDGFSVVAEDQIREMRLEEGVYIERIWRKANNGWQVMDEYIPRDSSGAAWNEIPFTFVGAENNDASVDQSRILSMVDMNVGHYRNSADYEDSVFWAGQSQPWMSGITLDMLKEMQDGNVYVGSRTLLSVPAGESFGFATADPNPMVRQAMIDKVDMMVGLGARMIQPGTSAKTATQVSGEREAQHSMLSLIASNVSEAYTRCLEWVGRYMGVTEEMTYTLNQEFVDADATPQELQAIMAGFLQGTMPMGDYVRYMQSRGFFDQESQPEDYAELLPLPGGTGLMTGPSV